MHYPEFQIAMTLSLNSSFMMTKTTTTATATVIYKYYASFERFDVFQVFLSALNVSLLLRTADAEISRSLQFENPELTNVLP